MLGGSGDSGQGEPREQTPRGQAGWGLGLKVGALHCVAPTSCRVKQSQELEGMARSTAQEGHWGASTPVPTPHTRIAPDKGQVG